MKYEYLIFNIIVISGPLFFGSLKKFYFWHRWKETFLSIIIAAIPFLLWDISVTNRHWFFADSYIIGIRIFNLPLEEVLFFISVPYACLFTWEMLNRFSFLKMRSIKKSNRILLWTTTIVLILAIFSFYSGKEYTSLSLLFFLLSILFDMVLGAKIITNRLFLYYFGLVSIFTFIFNGYLTWRPIVTYNSMFQLDLRVFTIPVEDFLFGYALLIICTSIFEKLLNRTVSVND